MKLGAINARCVNGSSPGCCDTQAIRSVPPVPTNAAGADEGNIIDEGQDEGCALMNMPLCGRHQRGAPHPCPPPGPAGINSTLRFNRDWPAREQPRRQGTPRWRGTARCISARALPAAPSILNPALTRAAPCGPGRRGVTGAAGHPRTPRHDDDRGPGPHHDHVRRSHLRRLSSEQPVGDEPGLRRRRLGLHLGLCRRLGRPRRPPRGTLPRVACENSTPSTAPT
jgi:hypothetical protein